MTDTSHSFSFNTKMNCN